MVADLQIFLNLEVVCDLHCLFFIFVQQNFLPPIAIRDGIGSYQYSIILAWVASSCSSLLYLMDQIYLQPIACTSYHSLDFSHLFSRDSAKGVRLLHGPYPFEESSKCIHLPYFEDPKIWSELRPDLPLKEEAPCDAGKPCCILSSNSTSIASIFPLDTNPC